MLLPLLPLNPSCPAATFGPLRPPVPLPIAGLEPLEAQVRAWAQEESLLELQMASLSLPFIDQD